MEDVENLSRMQHLKIFCLSCGCLWYGQGNNILAIVHAVGRVPFLERFHASNFKEGCSSFFQQYVDLYPKKKLILEEFW